MKPTGDGIKKSAAHPHFASVIMAISRSAKIKSNDKVGRNDEANSNNMFGSTGAHSQVSIVQMATSSSPKITSDDKVDNCCQANSHRRVERIGACAQF